MRVCQKLSDLWKKLGVEKDHHCVLCSGAAGDWVSFAVFARLFSLILSQYLVCISLAGKGFSVLMSTLAHTAAAGRGSLALFYPYEPVTAASISRRANWREVPPLTLTIVFFPAKPASQITDINTVSGSLITELHKCVRTSERVLLQRNNVTATTRCCRFLTSLCNPSRALPFYLFLITAMMDNT